MKTIRIMAALAALALFTPLTRAADQPWVVYEGGDGPGKGKHVVLVSGDEDDVLALSRALAFEHNPRVAGTNGDGNKADGSQRKDGSRT